MPLKHTELAISFLICTRNRAEIVRNCVLNLLNFAPSDVEVIVRDNCSTDNTLQILQEIHDERLKIYVAPENQGTLSFFEISKLASGRIVTWLSDEDDFQFEHLDYITSKFEDPSCDVILGSIIVGRAAHHVTFSDEAIDDPVCAGLLTLLFSGCGGVFIRNSCLSYANTFNVTSEDDAYVLWNYYPVSFFASRCVDCWLVTTSRTVVKQARFANTTHNWNIHPEFNSRLPHYYPESVFDRLGSNICNILFQNVSVIIKSILIFRLIKGFYKQANAYKNSNFIMLLQENYDSTIVKNYINHINNLKLDKLSFRFWWLLTKTIMLVGAVRTKVSCWAKLQAKRKLI